MSKEKSTKLNEQLEAEKQFLKDNELIWSVPLHNTIAVAALFAEDDGKLTVKVRFTNEHLTKEQIDTITKAIEDEVSEMPWCQ